MQKKMTGQRHKGQGCLPRDARSASAVLLSYVVRPSVRPSVTLMYAEHIGWTSSKLITRIIIVFAPRSHNIGNLVQVEHP